MKLRARLATRWLIRIGWLGFFVGFVAFIGVLRVVEGWLVSPR